MLHCGVSSNYSSVWKTWSMPKEICDLNTTRITNSTIEYTRIPVHRPLTGLSKIDMYLTVNGVAPTGTFLAVWDCQTRALISATAVGAMDVAWTNHLTTWQQAIVPAFNASRDFYVGVYGVSANMPAFAGKSFGGSTDDWYNFDGAGVVMDRAGYITGPFGAVPDPLPARTSQWFRPRFYGIK